MEAYVAHRISGSLGVKKQANDLSNNPQILFNDGSCGRQIALFDSAECRVVGDQMGFQDIRRKLR